MYSEINDLAKDIISSRDIEISDKLFKIKDLVLKEKDPKRFKLELYKSGILDVLSVSLKNEHGFIQDGWAKAIELAKILCFCTNDVGINETNYKEKFLFEASENFLVLAKKLQDKHVKQNMNSDEFLNLFRALMKEYSKLVDNNSFIAIKCLKSERLLQLLLSDEQYTSAIVINTYKDIFLARKNILKQLDDKHFHFILDEVIYKLAISDLIDIGRPIFSFLNNLSKIDQNVTNLITRRYKGIRLLIKRWKEMVTDNELEEFSQTFYSAHSLKMTNQEMYDKIIKIQALWRGYIMREKLRKANKSLSAFHIKYRQKKEAEKEKKANKKLEEDMKFFLLIEHRRKQRQRKVDLMKIIEILPPFQIKGFLEKQRDESAKKIQAYYRGYRERKLFSQRKHSLVQQKAAICIQRAVKRWLDLRSQKLNHHVIYSRPTESNGLKREQLFDNIRAHLESMPPNPRTQKAAEVLHDKAQQVFNDYVVSQSSMKKQLQNVELLLALNSNDADLILECSKLNQINENQSVLFSHKSRPVHLASKAVHKRMLEKQRLNWFEKLNDSDSENDDDDAYNDTLSNNLMLLNFTQNNYKHYDGNRYGKHLFEQKNLNANKNLHGLTKSDKKSLKTNNLHNQITHMMKKYPDESTVWNADLF